MPIDVCVYTQRHSIDGDTLNENGALKIIIIIIIIIRLHNIWIFYIKQSKS